MVIGDARKLDAATEMLDTILRPGGRLSVTDLRWSARSRGIGWRTVKEAKRLAGNIQAVKQRGNRACWVWVRGGILHPYENVVGAA
jgi:hypothetical protein